VTNESARVALSERNLIKPTAPADKGGDAKTMNKPENTPKIRPAQVEDQKQISSLLSEFKLPLDGLENTKMWVLQENNGNIVGTAGLEIWEEKGLLRSVVVNKNLHNRDYGTSLVNYVINEARKSGINELLLLTQTAQTFFQKLGFKNDDREHVTGSITTSAEFREACPKTATLMRLSLT
jgi:amino-acid N-acetyltransferase